MPRGEGIPFIVRSYFHTLRSKFFFTHGYVIKYFQLSDDYTNAAAAATAAANIDDNIDDDDNDTNAAWCWWLHWW